MLAFRYHGCTLQLNLKLTFLLKLHAPESWLAVYYESFGQKNMARNEAKQREIPWYSLEKMVGSKMIKGPGY